VLAVKPSDTINSTRIMNTMPAEDNPYPEQEHVDAVLARDLNQMSFKEREKVFERIHGVDETVEETKELVEESLVAIEEEIRKIFKKPAYDQAERRNRDYVTDRKFRLMFLRAECFDPPRAASRLVLFLERKLDLFGPDALWRPLRIDDLNDETRFVVESGRLQLMPRRDRAGRPVLVDCQVKNCPFPKKPLDLVRYDASQ
jgi:hypothetical protein